MSRFSGVVIGSVIVLAVSAKPLYAGADNVPRNNGSTMGRMAGGTPADAIETNPALLGAVRVPRSALGIFPFTGAGAGYWSDVLEIGVFRDYIYLGATEQHNAFNRILGDAMGVHAMDDSAAAQSIHSRFSEGAMLYGGLALTFVNFTERRFALSITSQTHSELHLPEAGLVSSVTMLPEPELARYSTDGFGLHSIWQTKVNLATGFALPNNHLNTLLRLRRASMGVRLSYVMGHTYLKTSQVSGGPDGEWQGTYQGAGIGMSPTGFNTPLNGHGFEVGVGTLWYGERASFAVVLDGIGATWWQGDVAAGNLRLTPLDWRYNNYLPVTARDTTGEIRTLTTIQPARVSMAYAYQWQAPRRAPRIVHNLAHTLDAAATVAYAFSDYPGRSPGFSGQLGLAAGLAQGVLPVRAGWGVEAKYGIASALGIGLEYRHQSVHLSYKAIGSPLWVPRRGFEVSAGIAWPWNFARDLDFDGVVDTADACAEEPEDRDRFQDEDGCPDPDNDQDGIPDVRDNCPNQPEDRDGFEDQDGCPDSDNDKDGIPDSLDQCPEDPEDFDGYRDDDGCPERDRDRDGVPDSTDQCVDQPEDIDGFEDQDGCQDSDNDKDRIADSLDQCPDDPEDRDGIRDDDGCPDPDNDEDGIPDSLDQCPDSAETANNFQDDDGCPDLDSAAMVMLGSATAPPVDSVLSTPAIVSVPSIGFGAGSTTLSPATRHLLDSVAILMKLYAKPHFEVQGHSDTTGSAAYNLVLSAMRARVACDYLIAKGIDSSRFVVVGYGGSRPVATNTTARGRALNRRVQILRVKTREEFTALQQIEAQQRQDAAAWEAKKSRSQR